MTVPEIRKKIESLLEQQKDGVINSSDQELCRLIGVDDYTFVQQALASLKEDGKISWFRSGDGAINNIKIIR